MVARHVPSPGSPASASFRSRDRFFRIGEISDRVLAVLGIAVFLWGTRPGLSAGEDRIATASCLAVAGLFAVQYLLRLHRATDRVGWALSAPAMVDLISAAAVPLALLFGAPPATARLFGVLWSLKLIRLNPALLLLARVLRSERQPLLSVTTAFIVVILFTATAVYLVERGRQPEAFGGVPDALWWAITTITTTGYGDRIPASPVGRLIAGAVMVAGIGLFALWAGILAGGFSRELRRQAFLESWDLVVRLPLFRNLGAPALAEISRLMKVENFRPGAVIVTAGQPGDSMYFIAEGEVQVETPTARIPLGPGQFFGEMALLTGAPRNATVTAGTNARLLRLDVVDFRALAGRQPELLHAIEAESARRKAASAAR